VEEAQLVRRLLSARELLRPRHDSLQRRVCACGMLSFRAGVLCSGCVLSGTCSVRRSGDALCDRAGRLQPDDL
jgi:hypothetical protein